MVPKRSSRGRSAVRELERNRDVVARVGAEASGRRPVVAADDAGMERHHEPVVARHPCHLEHHVPPEGNRLGRRRLPASAAR